MWILGGAVRVGGNVQKTTEEKTQDLQDAMENLLLQLTIMLTCLEDADRTRLMSRAVSCIYWLKMCFNLGEQNAQ